MLSLDISDTPGERIEKFFWQKDTVQGLSNYDIKSLILLYSGKNMHFKCLNKVPYVTNNGLHSLNS